MFLHCTSAPHTGTITSPNFGASLERVDALGLLNRLFDLPSRLFKKHRWIVELRCEAGLIEERTEGVCDGAGERLQVVPSF
jgi:hypothetical protein